ncbi:unnamed protein product, partial [Mesorhabditis spiculigera]
MEVTIRELVIEDAEEIRALIQGLAEYEKMPDSVELTVPQLQKDIGSKAVLGFTARDSNNKLAGMVLFYMAYSTWQGQYVHMEDLYVNPKLRRSGIGLKLWARVAQFAKERNIKRLQWNVLDWNTDAIFFYEKQPCVNLTKTEGWYLFRMGPDDINHLSKSN